MRPKLWGFITFICFVINPVYAVELRVAVASNFKSTAKIIAAEFEKKSSHKITLISASTGALYSLISHGAPYDIFLSADQKRPTLLVKSGLAHPDSLFTYAIGQLAFWAPNAKNIEANSISNIINLQTGKLVIANPKLAPYGASAWKYIKDSGLTTVIEGKLIKGNNITQALQFIASGNASSGFVSYSELLHGGIRDNFILLPPRSYQPIIQQGIILRRTKHLEAAKDLFDFMKNEGKTLILSAGYALPKIAFSAAKVH